ncbi:hypothetical protein D7Z26_09890 [Cohnella endophytica]|uniref:Uncharacterized protein n=1 Tax=Cohnella endophytica TaxID=2419778 RepID=A0A494Y598_9BACL|nr:hypothetical protein [Cohnella endophytica]RKP55486.1 hypothetical protein D7Z26_09890 [Cohnella endophytica]
MHKYRSWLMGLGIGIVIGASMLQLILLAKDQVKQVEATPISRERLNEEAVKEGLVLLTQNELDAKLKQAAKESKGTEQSEASPSPSSSPSPTPSPSSSPEASEKPDQKDEQPSSSSSEEKLTLYVSPGMTLTEVANDLKKLGLIGDVNGFIKHAKPISKKMNVGNAIFVGKPTYQQIMDELARKK